MAFNMAGANNGFFNDETDYTCSEIPTDVSSDGDNDYGNNSQYLLVARAPSKLICPSV